MKMKESVVPQEKPEPPKKKSSKLPIFLLLILMIGGGAYFGYDYQPQDVGEVTPMFETFTEKFIENSASAGQLFIITGKVKSSFGEARNAVKIIGNLHTLGKQNARTEVGYGGNILTDTQLSELDLETIKKKLNTPNKSIKPNKSLEFMVVFSNLPEDLDSYDITVTSNSSLKG